jgi:hypothetical protein
MRKTSRQPAIAMPPFLFRCPNTGFRVQGFAADDGESKGDGESEETDDVFVSVTCVACGSVHLVNPKTGKTAGESNE